MSQLKANNPFPSNIAFTYIPYTPETSAITSCGIPQKFSASEVFSDKKVVLISVPGAFTPTCSANHLPPFLSRLSEIKSKGVDLVVVIASNDPYVMSAWGKANGVKNDEVLFMSDTDAQFSKSIGWNLGERGARYALVVERGRVVYAEREMGREVGVSGVDAVLAEL